MTCGRVSAMRLASPDRGWANCAVTCGRARWRVPSIEGFHVPAGEGPGIVAGAAVPEAGDTGRMALASYARAMDHVGTMAIDPHFRWSDRVILDLHYDACVFQRNRSPGL
jgi:hypothetical protein